DSNCSDFGRNVPECRDPALEELSAADWAQYETLSPDCGGAFLVYWFQSMPGVGSGQFHDDGRPMLSMWPFLFYLRRGPGPTGAEVFFLLEPRPSDGPDPDSRRHQSLRPEAAV